jgi:hypothetical protein
LFYKKKSKRGNLRTIFDLVTGSQTQGILKECPVYVKLRSPECGKISACALNVHLHEIIGAVDGGQRLM